MIISDKINDQLDKFVEKNIINEEQSEFFAEMFNALIVSNVLGTRISYCHWQEQYVDKKQFNLVVRLLGDLGWISSVIESNYATIEINEAKLLQYVTAKEWQEFKLEYLVNEKALTYSVPKYDNLSTVRMPSTAGGTKKIKMKGNLIRKGFARSGGVPFQIDSNIVESYRDEFHYEITKGLQEVVKQDTASRRNPIAKTDYREIVDAVLNRYVESNRYYTLGENISDSRGRAIFDALSKVGNPISSKLFRASLVIKPERLNEEALNHVWRAIADMAHMEFSTQEEKINVGAKAYTFKQYSSDLFETIWLQRVYKALDKHFNDEEYLWDVPIEIDVNSSMVTNAALLLNNHNMMKDCNLIAGQEEVHDPWLVNGVLRKIVKSALTPNLYGSRAKIRTLIADELGNVDYDAVEAIVHELTKSKTHEGKYYNFTVFKNFILDKCQTAPEMNVKLGETEFKVVCNRFKWDKTDTEEVFLCWDNTLQSYMPITRSVKRMPDTSTFNLYMVTLILHHLDSVIADKICQNVDCLPIHDAFIMHPNYVSKAKETYLEAITYMYKNRKSILDEYFLSIGITEAYPHNQCEELELSSYSLR